MLLRGQIPPPDPGPEPLNQHHERVISCGFLAKSSVDGVGAAGSNERTQRAEDKAVPKLASRPHVGREIPRSDRYCRELIGGEFPVIQGRSGFSSVLSVVRCRSHNPKVAGSNPAPATNEDAPTCRLPSHERPGFIRIRDVCVLARGDGVASAPAEVYPKPLGGFGRQLIHPKEIGVLG